MEKDNFTWSTDQKICVFKDLKENKKKTVLNGMKNYTVNSRGNV